MKRIALLLIVACMIISCNRKDDTTIYYNGFKNLNIVLLEELKLDVSSEDPVTYYSDNELCVSITQDGKIKGKNIGEANITISNSENSISIHVVVSLFEEPSFEFGSSVNHIISIHGTPRYNIGDSLLVYGGGDGDFHDGNWCSYAVWRTDFFFIDNQYIESDLYIRKDLDIRVEQYLDEKYHPFDTITNQDEDGSVVSWYLYLDNEKPELANIIVGKQYNIGAYDDIRLSYAPFTYD